MPVIVANPMPPLHLLVLCLKNAPCSCTYPIPTAAIIFPCINLKQCTAFSHGEIAHTFYFIVFRAENTTQVPGKTCGKDPYIMML